eukprot:4378741-Amphidinium_carterae.1
MRQEHFERLRRRGAALGAAGGGQASEDLPVWDAACPWEWVFATSVTDRAFWHDELDAPVLLATSQGFGPAGSWRVVKRESSPPPHAASAKRKRQGSKPHSSDRFHQVDEHGHFEINRRGKEICRAYNKGDCT